MECETVESRETVDLGTCLTTAAVSDDLHAMRMARTATVSKRDGLLWPSRDRREVRHGFVDGDNLAKLLSGREYRGKENAFLAPGFRERIRTVPALLSRSERAVTGIEDVVEALRDGTATPDDVVLAMASGGLGRVYTDRHGRRLPTAVFFGERYGSSYGWPDSRCYRVDALAEHLLARADAVVYRHDWARSVDAVATGVDEAVVRGGQRCHMNFSWCPTDAAFSTFEAATSGARASHDAHDTIHYRAIFDLDLLGARAAGCALFDVYGPPAWHGSLTRSGAPASATGPA